MRVCIVMQNSHLAPKHTRLIEQEVSGYRVMCVCVCVCVCMCLCVLTGRILTWHLNSSLPACLVLIYFKDIRKSFTKNASLRKNRACRYYTIALCWAPSVNFPILCSCMPVGQCGAQANRHVSESYTTSMPVHLCACAHSHEQSWMLICSDFLKLLQVFVK